MKYIITCRYEYRAKEGKKFTNWHVYDIEPLDEKDAKEQLAELKTSVKDVDKKTKLKHEYCLKDYDEWINEEKENKKELKQILKKQKEYLKSNEYKELKRKKRAASKERKERQKKYILEHEHEGHI